jgi:hypothetical protein
MAESFTRIQVSLVSDRTIDRAIDCLQRFYPGVQIQRDGSEIALQSDLPPAQLRGIWFSHLHEARARDARIEQRDDLIRELFL